MMRFIPTTSIITSDSALRYLFAWLNFMRTPAGALPTDGPGWSIVRSCDGTAYTDDGVGGLPDNIVDFNDLTTYVAATNISWFVLRSPDAAYEYLFYRYSTLDYQWGINYSPGALFIGGDETVIPTATDAVNFCQTSIVSPGIDCTLHMGADDASPYGFFAYMHANGNFADGRAGMARIPITDSAQPGDIEAAPHVFAVQQTTAEIFIRSGMSVNADSNTTSRCVSIPPGQAAARTTPAWYFRDANDDIVCPNDVPVDDNGADVGFPIPFGVNSSLSAPTGFKGFSTFCQWNGMARAAGETFATKTRVSWGDVNFPWDGSVPVDS